MSFGSGADIFGSAAGAGAGAAPAVQGEGRDGKVTEPRVMLKNMDAIASKAFDPYGVSVIDDISLEKLWEFVKKGDKWTKFYCELAADEASGGAYRIGIGVSRFSGLLLAVIKELEERTDFDVIFNERVLAKAREEAAALKPHLKVLNKGRGSQSYAAKEETINSLKRRRVQEEQVEAVGVRDLQNAAAELWAWMRLGMQSPLRSVIVITSAGGVFYAAHASDKTARAWASAGGGSCEKMTTAIQARHEMTSSSSQLQPAHREQVDRSIFD